MIMPPHLRTFALTAHVTFSVGWIGAVLVFLALTVIGLTSPDAQTVRGAYVVMEPAAWFVLVPLAFASLLTGILMSLGTSWGLFRHYWVLFKFVLAVFATLILLVYMGTFRYMAGVAADPSIDLSMVRNPSPGLHAVLALLVLLVTTVLAVYKPRGMTQYGRRKLHERRGQPAEMHSYQASSGDTGEDTGPEQADSASAARTRTMLYVLLGIIGFALLFVALHIAAGGLEHH